MSVTSYRVEGGTYRIVPRPLCERVSDWVRWRLNLPPVQPLVVTTISVDGGVFVFGRSGTVTSWGHLPPPTS